MCSRTRTSNNPRSLSPSPLLLSIVADVLPGTVIGMPLVVGVKLFLKYSFVPSLVFNVTEMFPLNETAFMYHETVMGCASELPKPNCCKSCASKRCCKSIICVPEIEVLAVVQSSLIELAKPEGIR